MGFGRELDLPIRGANVAAVLTDVVVGEIPRREVLNRGDDRASLGVGLEADVSDARSRQRIRVDEPIAVVLDQWPHADETGVTELEIDADRGRASDGTVPVSRWNRLDAECAGDRIGGDVDIVTVGRTRTRIVIGWCEERRNAWGDVEAP